MAETEHDTDASKENDIHYRVSHTNGQSNGFKRDLHLNNGNTIVGENREIKNTQDIPIDFSVKRRSFEITSESFTDESQISSVSPPADQDSQQHYLEQKSNETISNDSYRSIEREQISEPRISRFPPDSPDRFSGISDRRVSNCNGLGDQSDVAEFMDQRFDNEENHSRPFKTYHKDPLSVSLGYYGSASIPHSQVDRKSPNINPDEVMNMYKQQIQVLRERDKQLLSMAKQHMNSETTQRSNSGHSSGNSNNDAAMSPTIPSAMSPSSRFTPPTSHLSPIVSSNLPLTATGRKRPRSLPEDMKDGAYWERRRKNNEAAKRSRDARRAKEDEIAIRAALLEQENLKLRVEVAALKTETARLRCMLYNN